MLVYSTPLVNCCTSTFSLTSSSSGISNTVAEGVLWRIRYNRICLQQCVAPFYTCINPWALRQKTRQIFVRIKFSNCTVILTPRHKIWNGDENLRHVLKKTFNEILSGCCILDFLVHRKYGGTRRLFYEMKTFFLNRSNGVSIFYTDLKNVYLIFVKSTAKKVLPKNLNFLGLQYFNWEQYFRFFYWDKIYIFEISTKGRIFYTPVAISKEKSVHLFEGTRNTFWELRSKKYKKPLNIRKNGCLKQVLDFQRPFKILWHTSEL